MTIHPGEHDCISNGFSGAKKHRSLKQSTVRKFELGDIIGIFVPNALSILSIVGLRSIPFVNTGSTIRGKWILDKGLLTVEYNGNVSLTTIITINIRSHLCICLRLTFSQKINWNDWIYHWIVGKGTRATQRKCRKYMLDWNVYNFFGRFPNTYALQQKFVFFSLRLLRKMWVDFYSRVGRRHTAKWHLDTFFFSCHTFGEKWK